MRGLQLTRSILSCSKALFFVLLLLHFIGFLGLAQEYLFYSLAQEYLFYYYYMGVDARAIAMGGAFVGVANNYSACHWNPAGVAKAVGNGYTQAGVMNSNLSYLDIFKPVNCRHGSAVWPASNLALGISVSLIVGETPSMLIVSLCNAIPIETAEGLRFFIGSAGKYVHFEYGQATTSVVGFDAGILIDGLLPGLTIGAVVHNFGSMGNRFFQVGFGLALPRDSTLAASIDIDIYVTLLRVGVEFNAIAPFSVRVGILHPIVSRVFRITAGVGLTLANISVDLAWFGMDYGSLIALSGNLKFGVSKPKSYPPQIANVEALPTADPLVWSFKVSATDPDDDIVSYEWDFGDGTIAQGASIVKHTYNTAGTYRVCVEVRDKQNLTDEACKTVTVEKPAPKANQPPRADFHWVAPALEERQPVQFVSDSVDPEGALASLEWDFGDGTRQTTTAQTISHAFAKAGTYRVCLTATDAAGLSNQICKEIKIGQRWAAPSNEKTRFFMSVVSRDNNRQPVWSPDGKLIMFTSDRDMDWELYTINLDTQAVSRVTKSPGPDFNPSWCRDGKVIFVSDRDGQRGTDLYVLDMTTLGVTRLTHDPAYLNIAPSCAPDGRTVIFTTNRDGDFEIYSITTETRAVNRITFSPVQDWNPQVSPDGKYIAFQSQVQGNSEIFVMDITGRNLRRLTFNPGEDIEPAWSPDGKKIAFASNRDGNFKIYVIDVTGENEVVLTPDTNNNLHPVWSPDGKKIAFESDRTRNWEIWVMDADGKNLKRLTGVSK